MFSTNAGGDLGAGVKSELLNIPIDQWGFFFPIHVAVWRYLHTARPSLLGKLDAGYDDEPYFRGKGADWFIKLTNNPRYIDLAEQIMYTVASQLPQAALERGFVREAELPDIDSSTVDQLCQVIIAEAESTSTG